MIGDFTYYNPTRLHFGPDSLHKLEEELSNVGDTVMLVYGGGSIKRIGLYEKIRVLLEKAKKRVIEFAGVQPNPEIGQVEKACAVVREEHVSLILAVGGGSVIDFAKAVSVSAYCEGDPWTTYFLELKPVTCQTVPVGSVLTVVGTGSEANGTAVITNDAMHMKIGRPFGWRAFPRFAIINPELTLSVPEYQMVAGAFDIMSHAMEQYFSGDDDSASDYMAEGLMRAVIAASRKAVQDPHDYEARSNLAWCASWGLNTFLACGKATDWMVHMIGQAIGAHTNATHGMTLSAVALPYYRLIMGDGLPKFVRFAKNVWDISERTDDGVKKPDEQIAREGIDAMEAWMRELGLVMDASELGVNEDMIEPIVASTIVMKGGYRVLNQDEIRQILRESLRVV